jgi:hypothetical protein
MKKQMILGAMIVMLGASSASAEGLSPAAEAGSGAAMVMVQLAQLLRIGSPEGIQAEFGPCEDWDADGATLNCSGVFFFFTKADVLVTIWVGEYTSTVDKDFDQREWVAAAAFRLNKETGVNFKDNGEDAEGWHELVWLLRDEEFFLRLNKKKGNASIGVKIR